MDSNVLEPHWLGTADEVDRNRIRASAALAQAILDKVEREVALTKQTRRGVRIGDVIRSHAADSSGTGFLDCCDRFVRTARPSYGWSARLLFAVEPGVRASRGTSGCDRSALGNSGVAACRWTTVERKPSVEREVGTFPVYLADVVATRLPFGRTGRARDSQNARREALHGVSRHTKRPGTWLEKPVEGRLPVSSDAQSVHLGGTLRVDCTCEECPLASAKRE